MAKTLENPMPRQGFKSMFRKHSSWPPFTRASKKSSVVRNLCSASLFNFESTHVHTTVLVYLLRQVFALQRRFGFNALARCWKFGKVAFQKSSVLIANPKTLKP